MTAVFIRCDESTSLMKSNSISFRAGVSRPRFHQPLAAIVAVGLSLFTFALSTGHAAGVGGGTKSTSALRTNPDGSLSWCMRVDPADVQAFQFTVTFDPTRAQPDAAFGTGGVIFKAPFNGTVTNPVAGQLVVSGFTAPGNVTPGDVDTFEVIFANLQPLLSPNGVAFTVGGIGPTDFLQTFDPNTNATNIIPSAQIGTVTRTSVVGASSFIWDPDSTYNNGTTGGAGTWNTTTPTFDNIPTVGPHGHDPALANVGWSTAVNSTATNIAVFGGNPGTGLVTVSGAIPVGGLQFDAAGYQLSGGNLTLSAAPGATPTIEVRDGTATVNTLLSGSGLTKTGPGTVVLGAANNYTGPTKISAGTISVATLSSGGSSSGIGASSSAAANLVFDGGTLQYTGGGAASDRGFTITPGKTATFDVANPSANLTMFGAIAPTTGGLTKTGPGTLILSSIGNAHSGPTTIAGGALQIFSDQNLGAAPPSPTAGSLVFAGGTLRDTSSMTLNANRGVTVTPAGGTINITNPVATLLYAGVIAGPGNLTKIGPGTLLLTGANTYTGITQISAGTVINNGSLAGSVALNAGRFRGSGSTAGALIVGNGVGANDAVLEPASAGVPVTMSLAGLSLNSDALFHLTLDSDAVLADQLLINGNAFLGNGVAQLSLLDLGSTTLSFGTSFTILDNLSGVTTGFFEGLPDGASLISGLNTFAIEYNVGPLGNNVKLKVVPEADAAGVLGFALLLAAGARRVRFRRG